MKPHAEARILFRQTNRLFSSCHIHQQRGRTDLLVLESIDHSLGNRSSETEIIGVDDETMNHEPLLSGARDALLVSEPEPVHTALWGPMPRVAGRLASVPHGSDSLGVHLTAIGKKCGIGGTPPGAGHLYRTDVQRLPW